MKKLFAILVLLFFTLNAYGQHRTVKPIKQHNLTSKHAVTSAKHKKAGSRKRTHERRQDDVKDIFLAERKYDELFRQWGTKYMPNGDYKLLKALCTVESGLKPNSKSDHGARGLCQIMPGTWASIHKSNRGLPKNGYNVPTHSIHAAAYHYGRLHEFWDKVPSAANRQKLVLASYNAGEGNIVKARRLCRNSSRYEDIMQCLPKVTGRVHSKETTEYVSLILDTAKS